MAKFEAATPQQIETILATNFCPTELSNAQKAARDYAMADKLDKRGDEYQAAGNFAMAAVCRSRALAACIRADHFATCGG